MLNKTCVLYEECDLSHDTTVVLLPLMLDVICKRTMDLSI
jgi:hypothetical protein